MVQQIDKQVLDSTLKCLDHFECWSQSAVLVKWLVEISVSHNKKMLVCIVEVHIDHHDGEHRQDPHFKFWERKEVQPLFNTGMINISPYAFLVDVRFSCKHIEIQTISLLNQELGEVFEEDR